MLAIDFAPAMIERAKIRVRREGGDQGKITFKTQAMHDLDDLKGTLDVAIAVNSLVMPDVRTIDRTLKAIRQSLHKDGVFLGVVPSMDAIHYQTMLLLDQSLDRGATPEEAERYAAHYAEHPLYEFSFGRFRFQGPRTKILAAV